MHPEIAVHAEMLTDCAVARLGQSRILTDFAVLFALARACECIRSWALLGGNCSPPGPRHIAQLGSPTYVDSERQ